MAAIVRYWRIARPGAVPDDAAVRVGLLVLLVVGFCALVIAAQMFRSQGAAQAVTFLKKVGWGYAIGMILLAAFQAWREWG